MAAGGQHVEHVECEAGNARRQNVPVQGRPGQLQALKLLYDFEQAGGAAAFSTELVPLRQKQRQRRGVDRCNGIAQLGQRTPLQAPQYVGLTPVEFDTAGANLTLDQRTAVQQAAQHRFDLCRSQTEVCGEFARHERAMRSRVAVGDERQGIVLCLDEGLRQAGRRYGAEGIAIDGGILRGDPALLRRNADRDGTAFILQLRQRGGYIAYGTFGDVPLAQVTELAQQVVNLVGVAGTPIVRQPLQFPFELQQHVGVDQAA